MFGHQTSLRSLKDLKSLTAVFMTASGNISVMDNWEILSYLEIKQYL